MSKLIKKTGPQVDAAIGIGQAPVWRTVYWDTSFAKAPEYNIDTDGGSTFYLYGTGNNYIGVIKDFHLLKTIDWDYADISGYCDFSYAPSLITGYMYYAECPTMDFRHCNKLEHLDVGQSYSSELTIDGCISLKYLDIQSCPNLNPINLSGLSNLETLWAANSNTTYYDLREMVNLTVLDLGDNQIDLLDISQNTALTHLYCDGTISLDFLDVNHLTSLATLNLQGANYTGFDIRLPNLNTLHVSGVTGLSNVNVSYCTGLQSLYYHIPNPVSIDISAISGLRVLSLNGCKTFNSTISGLSQMDTSLAATVRLSNCNLSAANLNSIMTDLPSGVGGSDIFWYGGNVGSATCDTSIATNKGWIAINL